MILAPVAHPQSSRRRPKKGPSPRQLNPSSWDLQAAFLLVLNRRPEIWIEALKKEKKCRRTKTFPGLDLHRDDSPPESAGQSGAEVGMRRAWLERLWLLPDPGWVGGVEPGWECGSAQWAASPSDHHGDHLTGPPTSLLLHAVLSVASGHSSLLPRPPCPGHILSPGPCGSRLLAPCLFPFTLLHRNQAMLLLYLKESTPCHSKTAHRDLPLNLLCLHAVLLLDARPCAPSPSSPSERRFTLRISPPASSYCVATSWQPLLSPQAVMAGLGALGLSRPWPRVAISKQQLNELN